MAGNLGPVVHYILLRKSEADTPSWSDVRPITVASSLYRLWARVRARRILSVLRERGSGLVRVNLPTTTIWGFVSDFLDFHDHQEAGSHPSGIVLDIMKAFNTLNRAILSCCAKLAFQLVSLMLGFMGLTK